MNKERTTREGQVTYPVTADRTAGLATGSGTSIRMHVAFLSLSVIHFTMIQKEAQLKPGQSYLFLSHSYIRLSPLILLYFKV